LQCKKKHKTIGNEKLKKRGKASKKDRGNSARTKRRGKKHQKEGEYTPWGKPQGHNRQKTKNNGLTELFGGSTEHGLRTGGPARNSRDEEQAWRGKRFKSNEARHCPDKRIVINRRVICLKRGDEGQ